MRSLNLHKDIGDDKKIRREKKKLHMLKAVEASAIPEENEESIGESSSSCDDDEHQDSLKDVDFSLDGDSDVEQLG